MSDESQGIGGLLVAIVGTLLVLGITVLVWIGLVAPVQTELTKTEKRTELKEKQLSNAKELLQETETRREEAQLDVRRLKRNLSKRKRTQKRPKKKSNLAQIESRISKEEKLDELIERLKRVARTSSVLVRKMEKGDEEREGPLMNQALQVELTGEFSRLVDWMKRGMSSGGRVVLVDSMKLTRLSDLSQGFAEPAENQRLRMKATLRIWMLSDDSRGKVPRRGNREITNRAWRTVRLAYWIFSKSILLDKRSPFEPRLHRFHETKTTSYSFISNARNVELY